jgi:signal transduction histidine kinase
MEADVATDEAAGTAGMKSSSSYDDSSELLSLGGLGSALTVLARRAPVPVTLRLSGDRRLPKRVEVAVYYLLSEALINGPSTHASVVEIDLEAAESTLRVTVSDDGVGGARPRADRSTSAVPSGEPPASRSKIHSPDGPSRAFSGRRET